MSDIIGIPVSQVTEVDLPCDDPDKFQERKVVVHLENGVRFALQQEHQIVDPVSGRAVIYSYDGLDLGRVPNVSKYDDVIAHSIRRMVSTWGWRDEFGLVLDNGLLLHGGYSDRENGLMISRVDASMEKDLSDIHI